METIERENISPVVDEKGNYIINENIILLGNITNNTMESDTRWYENSKNNCRNQASTSGAQPGRPPDKTPRREPREEKPDMKHILEEVSLVDDEDNPEELVNSFHNMTRKNILLPFTGVEIQEEFKFLEAIKQFKMILEEKVEVLTLRKNLKEMLYKYLLFFGSNYGRISLLYRDQYLDVMEEILLFYCDVVREYFRDQKRSGKKMKLIQEARRIKILFRYCLMQKMDRILHVLLKVRLAPEIEEYGLLWGDVYMYFLTKVPYKHTDDDILRGFIAFQKFKTIRTQSESPMIDKLMMDVYKKTGEELRRIPCLGEIMDNIKRDRFYTVRDMVTKYMRYYKEKTRNEGFEMDCDEDTDDLNINEMRCLDLSSSFPSISSACSSNLLSSETFSVRRKSNRKSIFDLANESNSQADQHTTEFSLFDEDIAKIEAPDDPVVVLDDEEDDDVIVVYDNLKTVITIDDDEEEPVEILPTKSPPIREALSPHKIIPELQPENSAIDPDENSLQNQVEEANTPQSSQSNQVQDGVETSSSQSILTPEGPPPSSAEAEAPLPCRSPVNSENTVPDRILTPNEPLRPEISSQVQKADVSVPPKQSSPFEKRMLTRQVKAVDNSLKITINSLSVKLTTPLEPNQDSESKKLVGTPTEQASKSSGDSMERLPNLDKESVEIQKVSSPSTPEKTQETASVAPSADEIMKESSQPKQKSVDLQISPPETSSVSAGLDERMEISSEPEQPHSGGKRSSDKTVSELSPESNLVGGLEKGLQSGEPELEKESFSDKPVVTVSSVNPSGSKGASDQSSESDCLNQHDRNEGVKERDSSSSSDTSGKLGNLDEHLRHTTSLSTKIIGVLPSCKIPSDLEDSPSSSLSSPNKNAENFAVPRRLRNVSETSFSSSPSFEIIDLSEVRMHFNGRQQEISTSFTNSSETDSTTSTTTTTSTSTSGSEPAVHVTADSTDLLAPAAESADSEFMSYSEGTRCDSDASSSDDEDAVIQEEEFGKDKNCRSAEDPNKAVQRASEAESDDLAEKASCTSNEPINYSAINDFLNKFTKELSVDDIFTNSPEVPSSPAGDLVVSTIDLVPSTENSDNVIMVKCRPIEPLKEEENIASGTEAVAFSTNEVLAPSDEPIALLVGFSEDENQHYVMCDANLTLSNEQLALPSDKIVCLRDDVASLKGDTSNKASVDDSRKELPARRETIDSSLSLSGSQPYTPQSSPSTRIETVGHDISSFDEGNNASVPCLKSGAAHTLLSSYANGLNDKKTFEHTTQTLERALNKITNRRTSAEKSSISRRKSSRDASPERAEKTDKRNCDTAARSSENSVEDFREDLSQSLTSAKRVTPQEVDKISLLPFKYSQQLWSDKSQQQAEIPKVNLFESQIYVEKPSQAKLSQQKIVKFQQNPQQTSNVGLQNCDRSLSQQVVNNSQPKQSANLVNSAEKPINDLSCAAGYVEDKLHELYVKEYGNSVSQQDSLLSQPKIQSKRRESRDSVSPARSVKIYAKELSQPKDRDITLKSYKAHIKSVTKRRTSFLDSTPQKDDGISQLHGIKPKGTEDISQQKVVSPQISKESSREVNLYDHTDLFNNGMEGPIGKPLGDADNDDGFFWDSDSDTAKSKDDRFGATIFVKPDSQLYQATKQNSPQKSLVSSMKGSRAKGENNLPEQKTPEKKKISFASNTEMRLYVKLTPIDIESNQRDLKRKISLANEMKRKQQQISLAQEMKEKQLQSLQRDQILIQLYSEKSEPKHRNTNNWFSRASASSKASSKPGYTTNSNVSSKNDPYFMQGKVRDHPGHKNGHRVAEKRKNRDSEPEAEIPRKRIAVRTDLMEKKPKVSLPNGKITTPKLKPIIKSYAAASRSTGVNDTEETQSSPVKMTKSGRVCKKPRTDYDDLIKRTAKVKKSVKFNL